jgi:hypothetical protein
MVIQIIFKLEAGQFDIETSFLYGKLEEDVWMYILEGYERYVKEMHVKDIHTNANCLKMTKAIYGIVQASRQWWKKLKDALAALNYIQSQADPCLFIKKKKRRDPT